MHRMFLITLMALVALAAAGCGGGGGGGETSPDTVSDFAGTWTIPSLGLPQDQVMITTGGVVYVNGESPTLAMASVGTLGYYTRIGTCSEQGALTLDGYWTYNGVLHRVIGNGSANSGTRTISVSITLLQNNRIVLQNTLLSGTLLNSTPPPLPDFQNGGSGDFDVPPPIPL